MAQIIFFNGLGLEHGASLSYQLEHHKNAISVGNAVLEKDPQLILYKHKEIDPHIWMDISLWCHIIDPILAALCQADPEGEGMYRINASLIKEKMEAEHQRIYEALQDIPQEKRYLVTSHDAFNYFTRAYLATPEERLNGQWTKRFEAPEGLAPEGQLSTSNIQSVIDHLIAYRIPIVFSESNVSCDSLKKIIHACAQKGLSVAISPDALYGDAMGSASCGASTYLTMIHYDANVLIEAWKHTDD
jgi:manganese/zinc/iron transport system substrate-binding protein